MKLADMGLRSGPNPCSCATAWNCVNPVTLYFRSSAKQKVATRAKCLLAATEQSMKTEESWNCKAPWPNSSFWCLSFMANENKIHSHPFLLNVLFIKCLEWDRHWFWWNIFTERQQDASGQIWPHDKIKQLCILKLPLLIWLSVDLKVALKSIDNNPMTDCNRCL